MKRRKFLTRSVTGGAVLGALSAQTSKTPLSTAAIRPPGKTTPAAHVNSRSGYSPFTTPDYYSYADDPKVERNVPGKPHKGKVLAAVPTHSDDIPLYAGELVTKLIDEGYTGCLIRISNDESAGKTLGYGVVQNEIDNQEVAKALGCTKAFSFYYRNHRMDDCAEIEIQSRLIFLFRVLHIDTIVTMVPYNHCEENPDHLVAARAAEAACWMAGGRKDYPEHYRAGLKPARVREKYYHARSPNGHNLVNRIVDIISCIDQKVRGNVADKGKGPAGPQGGGNSGSLLRSRLATQGKRLAILGNDDRTADREYVRHFMLDDEIEQGKPYGLRYAERYYYIDQRRSEISKVEDYVSKNAVAL